MALFILKKPDAQTLLAKVYADTCPAGYTASTEESAAAYIAAQLAAGWFPAPSAPAVAPAFVQTPLDLMERLTDAEKVGIFTSDDDGVVVFRNMAIAAQEIRSDDERTHDGLAYLESLGLLAPGRSAALLAP